MTPQEKANHLVSIHSLTVLSKIGHKLSMEDVKEIAKATVLVDVNELISSHNKWDDNAQTNTEEYYYWSEVKKELEI